MELRKTGRALASAATAVVIIVLIALCIKGGFVLSALQASTLKLLAVICCISALYCFITGELTKNYSQMDKLWSLLPIVYAWIIAARGGMETRLVIFACVVTLWGARLTFNFARKGAYRLKFWTGNEDYRWSIVRASRWFSRPFAWTLFDLLFISAYQNLLVLAITMPALASMGSSWPLGAWDLTAAILALSFLALETVSDEYQWSFHETKKGLIKNGEMRSPYDLGFNTLGPWAYMRHPNYLGEQGIWLSLYLFAIGAGAAGGGLLHWSLIGPLLLVFLFMGSSTLGENISTGKYPLYSDYREKVYKYLPVNKYAR